MQEIYVVLEGLPNGKWSAFLHTNGAGSSFMAFVGKEGAEEAAAVLNLQQDLFEVFPLNSAEAFEAIYGVPGIDYLAGRVPVNSDRFALAAEPLIRYLAHTHHPHTKVIVDSTSAELVEGMAVHRAEKFLVD